MQLENIKPNIRHLTEMKDVLFNKEWTENTSDLELYYMYRDLSENEEDKKEIIKQDLRYDITVIPNLMLGKEYNKTAGHDHPLVPETNLTYTEIYQVLQGQAIFLIQDSEEDKIKNVFAIKAEKDDYVIIPPNYEHLIINASEQELKTANWISRNFSSNIYKPFRSKHGFCYYAIRKDSEEIDWIKNKNYTDIPELKFLEPNLWLNQFNIEKETKIYELVKDMTKLEFLKKPQKYDWSKN
ncbi:MAG: glucose-6-phosphate isomerase family protein, partial [bacterium]